MGKYQQQLEQELSKFLGLKNVVLFSSCRNALYALLLGLKLKKSDEIIIQSFICDSLPLAIEKAGATIVKVEVDTNTFNLSADLVEKKINKNTKALIFVHTYGNPSGVKEIKELCEKHKIILIEDIAHALGASYGGKLAGTFGDYAVYSLTKQMINIGGGALLTNKDVEEIKELKEALANKKAKLFVYLKRLMASLYETRAFWFSKILINLVRSKKDLKLKNSLDVHFKCNSLEAYLALKQIKTLKKKIEKRKENHNFIKEKVKTQKTDEKAESGCNYLSFIFLNEKERDLAVKRTFLFLPPWPGSAISDKLAFVPNSPNFSKHQLERFIKTVFSLDKDAK